MEPSKCPIESSPVSLLDDLGKWALLLCGLFLLPTIPLLWQAITRHVSMSSLVVAAWRGNSWLSFGGNGTWERIGLSLFTFILIEGCAILFYRGLRAFGGCESRTEAAERTRYHALLRWTMVLSLALVLVIPFHSKDLDAYINYGAEQVFYGLDPYTFPVAALKGWHHNAMFHSNWVNFPSNYGFAFILLTRWMVYLSGGHFFITFILFKLLNLGAHVAVTALIYQISKSLNLKNPWLNAYLYGLNPLMLLHFVANGHNDILMTLPIMLSFWLLFSVKRWQSLVIPLWALGVLVKYAALVAAPFLLIFLFQTGQLQAIWIGMTAGLGLLGLLYLPFQDFSLRVIQTHPGWYEIKTQHSWQALVMSIYISIAKKYHGLKTYRYAIQSALSNLAWFIYLALWGRYLWAAWRSLKEPVQLIRLTALLMALLILLANRMFHPWYIGLFYPFMLLLPEADKLRRFGILLTFAALLSFTMLERSEIVSFLPMLGAWAWVYFPRELLGKLSKDLVRTPPLQRAYDLLM